MSFDHVYVYVKIDKEMIMIMPKTAKRTYMPGPPPRPPAPPRPPSSEALMTLG